MTTTMAISTGMEVGVDLAAEGRHGQCVQTTFLCFMLRHLEILNHSVVQGHCGRMMYRQLRFGHCANRLYRSRQDREQRGE